MSLRTLSLRSRIIVAATILTCAVVVTIMACSSSESHGGSPGSDGGSVPGTPARSWAGKDPAPAIPGGLTWFNVERPITLAELKGKIVLLDFWTLGCINCQHIIPDLKRLEDEFKDTLVVIGVHSGKYTTEHDDDAVREAVARYGLQHPVVNDPDFAVWNTFGANAWPTLVLIDPAGNLVGGHAGEGVYPLFEPIVKSLVTEFDAKGLVDRDSQVPLKLDSTATSTVLSFPAKVLADEPGGRLFIADSGHNRILISDLNGVLQQAIGDGKEGFADGAADEAEFRQPQGLGLSTNGETLYVADTRNHAVRAVNIETGEVTTIAGTGQQADRFPARDAKASETALASPWDVVNVGEQLYVSMAGLHQIWAIDLHEGTVAVFAGTSREGIDDGPRTSMATLAQPSGISTDGTYLYWADPESSSIRRLRLQSEGEAQVETLVGTGLFDYGNTDGAGRQAKLQHAQGVVYAAGKLYIGDTYNHEVRELDLPTMALTTLAGDGTHGWSDGTGRSARFDEPAGIGFADGRVFVADTNNHLIRVIDPGSGSVSTLTLTNLAVATASGPARKSTAQLDRQTIAPGATNLRITITAPGGYHLNSQAPSRMTFTSSNPAVAEIGEREVSWSSDEAEVRLPVPVMLSEGDATITGMASVYYCRTGAEALCFIQQVEITVPLRIAAASAVSEPAIMYTLPEGGG
ncbi:MAG: redoxin domain-containing protein [Dehalococcoidia bacterium]|nr:redoxin domain-containing protein [Dehalococcoidia bacterium]